MQKPFNITVYGAGAIGTTLAAWMTASGQNVTLLARGENAERLRQQHIQIVQGDKLLLDNTKVRVVEKLSEVDNIDLLIITVKNFNLDECCQDIVRTIGHKTLILGIQNGVENQAILPQYFERVMYAIINYNAWQQTAVAERDNDTLTWNVNLNGPIILGTIDTRYKDTKLQLVAQQLTVLFSGFIASQYSPRFQDHAHAKLVNNLANSVTTIIGNSHREPSALAPLQAVLTRLSYEGIKTLEAAGFEETNTGPLPPWKIIKLGNRLPALLTRPIFRRKLALIGSTSMAADIIAKGTGKSELESINGYMLRLAEKHEVDVPYSRGLYHLCKRQFSKPPFRPITAAELKSHLDTYVNGV